jgi:hypothetical protein
MSRAKDSARHFALSNKKCRDDRDREISAESYEFGYLDAIRQAELCYIYSSKDFLERIKELRK